MLYGNKRLQVDFERGLRFESPIGVASCHLTGSERALEQTLKARPAFLTLKTTSTAFGGDGTGVRRYERLDDVGLPQDFLADGPRTLEMLSLARTQQLLKFAVQNKKDSVIGLSVLSGEDFGEVLPKLDGYGADFIELNFKYMTRMRTPDEGDDDFEHTCRQKFLAECAAARAATGLPLFIKISRDAPWVLSDQTLRALEELGGLALIVANAARRPQLRKSPVGPLMMWGAHSGASLLPQTIAIISDVAARTTLPIVASGGVLSGDAAFACLSVGAHAVQLCSAHNFFGANTVAHIESGLVSALDQADLPTAAAAIGWRTPLQENISVTPLT